MLGAFDGLVEFTGELLERVLDLVHDVVLRGELVEGRMGRPVRLDGELVEDLLLGKDEGGG